MPQSNWWCLSHACCQAQEPHLSIPVEGSANLCSFHPTHHGFFITLTIPHTTLTPHICGSHSRNTKVAHIRSLKVTYSINLNICIFLPWQLCFDNNLEGQVQIQAPWFCWNMVMWRAGSWPGANWSVSSVLGLVPCHHGPLGLSILFRFLTWKIMIDIT